MENSPRVLLLIGNVKKYADYSWGSGTQELSFTYTVVDGDRSDNGIEISLSIDPSGGYIKNEGGNDAILIINSPGFLGRVDSFVPVSPSALSLYDSSTSLGNACVVKKSQTIDFIMIRAVRTWGGYFPKSMIMIRAMIAKWPRKVAVMATSSNCSAPNEMSCALGQAGPSSGLFWSKCVTHSGMALVSYLTV